MKFIQYMVEGKTDEPVAERLIQRTGLQPVRFIVGNGKSTVDKALNKPSWQGNLLVLRDLDHDAKCAPSLLQNLLPPKPPRGLCLRIAVRQIESWLLADVAGFSLAFDVNLKTHQIKPDESDNPKQDLINYCRRSKSRTVRWGMVPKKSGRTGPQYTTLIRRFARTGWNPDLAAKRSPSLARALAAIDRLTAEGIWR